MSDRVRKLVKWAGYASFAVVAFLFFFYLTFPCDNLKRFIETQLSASGDMEVTIGELGPRPLVGLSFKDVVFLIRPKSSDLRAGPSSGAGGPDSTKPKPIRVALDRLVLKFGLISALTGGLDVSFFAQGLDGEVEGSYEMSKKKGWAAAVEITRINLARVPYVTDSLGIPVGGRLSSKIDLAVPQDRFSDASGRVEVECDGCSVGDGKAKLTVPGNPILAMGVTLPQVRLGKLGGHVKIEKGIATLDNVMAQSPDIEVGVEGSFSLRNPIGYTNAEAYLRFKISPELKKRDPKFELLENGLSNARRADGFYGLRIVGSVNALRFLPSSVGPAQGPRAPGAPRPGFRALPAQGLAPATLKARGGSHPS
jgi:type II secretion system protein N